MKTMPKMFLCAFCATAFLALPGCDDKKEEPKTELKAADAKVEAKPAPAVNPPAGAQAAEANTVEKIGIPECDQYVEKYLQCIEQRFDETAQKDARQAVLATSKQWQQAAQGPDKDKLAEQCKQQLETAKRALADKDCQW